MRTNKRTDPKFRKSSLLTKTHYAINIAIAKFLHIFSSPNNKYGRYWIFGVADDIYANNVKVFFEYIQKNHPDITTFWICDESSIPELSKNIDPQKLVARRSIRNYLLAIDAEVAVYGFSDRDVAPAYYRLDKNNKTTVVNVSHGFDGLKGMPADYYTPLAADLICAASTYEMEMKINKCGADSDKVRLTGFARYDDWNIETGHQKEIKKIFIMPTWRDWYEDEAIEWRESLMYQSYSSVLKGLNELGGKYNLEILCKFHPRMSLYFRGAKWEQFEHVIMVDGSSSLQSILNTVDLVITDYSSIFWDVLYMGKPVFLYWFDEKEYQEKRGLLVDHSFYKYVFNDGKSLLDKIGLCVRSEMVIEDSSNLYFNWRDKGNCNRIYDEILGKLCEVNKCALRVKE